MLIKLTPDSLFLRRNRELHLNISCAKSNLKDSGFSKCYNETELLVTFGVQSLPCSLLLIFSFILDIL
jgi:hypothetical protein